MNVTIAIKEKLEKILEDLKIKFIYLNSDEKDPEPNYVIFVKPNGLPKEVGEIPIFIIVSPERNTISIGCTNIYHLKDNDSLLSILVAVNNTNMRIASGNLYLDTKVKTILYYQRLKFNDILNNLELDVISDCITSVTTAIILIYEEISKIHDEKRR